MNFGNSKIKNFIAFFGIATVLALMSIGIIITSEFASDYEYFSQKDFSIFYPRVVDEFTGVYTFFILIIFLLRFFKNYPLEKNNFKSRLPVYLLLSIAVGLTHTSMMYATRVILFPVFNLGEYDYGYIPYRIVMEYFKQFISFWAVFVLFVYFKTQKEKEDEKLRMAQLQEQLVKSRLQTLSSQLNPHFLFNTLNMISSVMYENPQTADKMISNLSELLRASLNGSRKEFHPLRNEIEILQKYIAIMSARFSDKLRIAFSIDDTASEASVPWFILQPLMENSIKYCMNETKTAVIEVSSKLKEGRIFLSVKDNGPGFSDSAKNFQGEGVGLSNLVDRLENIYGGSYSFEINNIPNGGAEVVIEIPFIQTKK